MSFITTFIPTFRNSNPRSLSAYAFQLDLKRDVRAFDQPACWGFTKKILVEDYVRVDINFKKLCKSQTRASQNPHCGCAFMKNVAIVNVTPDNERVADIARECLQYAKRSGKNSIQGVPVFDEIRINDKKVDTGNISSCK